MAPAVHASFPSSSPSDPWFVPASLAATPAHPFPAIFGNFHPFMRPNNTRGHLKGKLRFPWEKLRTGIGKIMISFHSAYTRARHAAIALVIAPIIQSIPYMEQIRETKREIKRYR